MLFCDQIEWVRIRSDVTGDSKMKRRSNDCSYIAFVCGIIILGGFLLFPVIHMRETMWNESFATMVESAGSFGVRHFSAWRFFSSILQKTEPEYYDSIAQFYGYKDATQLVLPFILPLLGGLGLLVTGLTKSGIGIIISGIISGASYLIQIGCFPENLSYSYGFSFWQFFLIVISVLGIITGFVTLYIPTRTISTAQSDAAKDRIMVTGYLHGNSGEFKDAEIPIQPGETIAIGRSATCNLVLQNPAVSRVHCYVQYDDSKGDYIVRDVSMHGVYDSFGKPIEKNVDVKIKPGTTIQIGKTDEVFALK